VPIVVDGVTEMVTRDEGIREGTTVETLANLKPAFKEDSKITAGNSSQITDGASAVLIMSAEKAEQLGVRPRARFHSFAVAGTDPVTMLKGPIPATAKIMQRSGLALERSTCSRSTRRSPRWCLRGEGTRHRPRQDQRQRRRSRSAIRSARQAQAAVDVAERARAHGRPHGLQTMCGGGGLAPMR
jgi:acetyl-CoA acyltransferase